ncbi:hypothetical protein NUW58_g1229 [Xylaria curta]|uniref:Uncharacterized protein n=1 Tax=Xylaria curta TaxID=42375 RepID=A0ACC1PN76_9PEZI|nr:hypothetical protein NUW58_g1229 [Xylaria curta]
MRRGDETLLGHVAANGNKETAEVLIKGGAAIEGNDDLARTPLLRAVEAGNLEMCLYLLGLKADPNYGMVMPDGRIAPLHLAVRGHEAIAKHLLEHGANIEARDPLQSTPLFIAALEGKLAMCQVLVDAGADINACAVSGDSVVSIAAKSGHLEVVRYVLTQGASVMPPPAVRGRKWKYFEFDGNVDYGRRSEILALLRAYKHG